MFPGVRTSGFFTRRNSERDGRKVSHRVTSLLAQEYFRTCSFPGSAKLQWQTIAGKYYTFFLSNSTINFLLTLKGVRSIDSFMEDLRQKKKVFTNYDCKIASVSTYFWWFENL